MTGIKIGIWGWWQGNNLGDNWIKSTLYDIFPEADFLPTSVQDFTGYDYIICGGGGLFIYDVIEPFSKTEIKVPYGIVGMGAEFAHTSNRALEISEIADFFYVRDEYSINCMNLPSKCRSYDITFFRPLPWTKKNMSNKLFLIWREPEELLLNEKFSDYIKYDDVSEKWMEVLKQNFSDIKTNDFQTNEWDLRDVMEDIGFVISGRYHGIVAAIQKGLPFIAIDICPKIRALANECGLGDYCIKITETDKIEDLIKRARSDIKIIREKELQYTLNAQVILVEQINNIKKQISKRTNNIKLIHYGSYWMGDNDVVHVMADDLKDVCDVKVIDLKAYSCEVDPRIREIVKTPNGTVCCLNTELIIRDIEEYKARGIVLNAGGLCIDNELKKYLYENNIVSVGISLSDPDVYPYNGKKYAGDFSIFYTNSKYAYEEQYDRENVNIKLLPFGASTKHHYYMPEIEKKYDLVIVGHAREDRIDAVNRLKKICKLGLYGNGWTDGNGVVNGVEHVKAINSGKMYLSFSHTMAGFENVKVGIFEAMACKQFVITSYMEELNDYFEIGKEIVCYKSLEELEEIVDYYMAHEEERERIRCAGYIRFLRDHTYQNRWLDIIEDIYAL